MKILPPIVLVNFLAVFLTTCKEPTKPVDTYDGKIVFSSSRDSDGSIHAELGTENEIYLMDVEGSNETRLTSNETWDEYPIFSPDGSRIVFESYVDWLEPYIYIMDADGGNVTNLTPDHGGRGPCFSPDGSKIAYQSGGTISIMDADGSDKTKLAEWELDYWYSFGQDYPFQFSPDGEKLLFFSRRNGGNGDIYVMNIDGTDVDRLTDTPGFDGSAQFSPDGSKILFTSFREGKGELYIMDADGSNQTQLTNTKNGNGSPQFSPDGTKIVFESYRDGDSQIYVMDADGGNQTRLTYDTENNLKPSFSPDGSKIVFFSGMNLQFDVYTIDVDGKNIQNLTGDHPGFDGYPQFQPHT